jgi:hypothetical protein
LQELGSVPGRFVLNDRANGWIVESHIERRGGDDDVAPLIDASVLGACAADASKRA